MPKRHERPRVLFLIRDWSLGGAERQLVELLRVLDKNSVDVMVASFYTSGALRADVDRIDGVRVFCLQKRGRWDLLAFLVRAVRVARSAAPDVIHGYQGMANLLALPLGWITGARVIWGVRASNMDMRRYDWLRRLEVLLERLASRCPELIICNSEAGRRFHVTLGFPERRTIVIPNGVDTHRFRPDPVARERVRTAWGVRPLDRLVGLVGRLDPMKDHRTFLVAAQTFAAERSDVRFVCVGDGPDQYARELRALAEPLALSGRLLWKAASSEVAPIYNALDLLTSSSAYGEGFSNVVAEAMATGLRCVVTDVGDSALIVGETGVVVPPGDPRALADAWRTMLAGRDGKAARPHADPRERVLREFSVEALGARTSRALARVLGNNRTSPRPSLPRE